MPDLPSAPDEVAALRVGRGWPSRTPRLARTILRLAGHASIAAALRHHARRPARPLRTIMNYYKV